MAAQAGLYMALDMDLTNGSGPCDPAYIDDSATHDLGETYQVAICAGGLDTAIGAFSATMLYDDTLNTRPRHRAG